MKPVELFQALERGEKIEVKTELGCWVTWQGSIWKSTWQFRIVPKAPKLVPHWPAVLRNSLDDYCFVTDRLWHSEEAARSYYGKQFVRLSSKGEELLEVKE